MVALGMGYPVQSRTDDQKAGEEKPKTMLDYALEAIDQFTDPQGNLHSIDVNQAVRAVLTAVAVLPDAQLLPPDYGDRDSPNYTSLLNDEDGMKYGVTPEEVEVFKKHAIQATEFDDNELWWWKHGDIPRELLAKAKTANFRRNLGKSDHSVKA